LVIQLSSVIAGINLFFTVNSSDVTTTMAEFTGELGLLTSVPSDLALNVFVGGFPTNLTGFALDNIEIFPTLQPYLVTQVRVSEVDLPDNYDGVNGIISVAPENGQAVRSAFIIRDYEYFVKESSLYVTQADQNGEPATWSVREVSPNIGTPSIRGVGIGEEWVVIAHQTGLYFFDGSAIGDDQKLSQEIQPTWDRINWAYGHTIDVKVNVKRKQIYVAVPMDDAIKPNRILTLDYTEGFGNPMLGEGRGRKWCPWLIAANSLANIISSNGIEGLWVGSNNDSGVVALLDDTQHSDNEVAINSYYQPGFLQNITRSQFGYLKANVSGSGCVNLTLVKDRVENLVPLRGWSLFESPAFDQERKLNSITQRAAIRFGTNLNNHWFSLQGMSLWVTDATWSLIRGINSR
jgi:hypothetical protein